MTHDEHGETPPPQRSGPDRRGRTLPLWHPRRLRGRRMKMRRGDEHDRPYFVDRVPWSRFILATLLLVLTLIDGMITVALLDHDCEEVNPVMRYLLQRGTWMFFAGKYILTAIFLPVALVMNQYRLFGTRLRVGHLLPIVALMYLVLITYQIKLWDERHAPASPAPVQTARTFEKEQAMNLAIPGGQP